MIKKYIYNLENFNGTRAEYLNYINEASQFVNTIPKDCAEKDCLMMAIHNARLEYSLW